jgi:hypothetical protein
MSVSLPSKEAYLIDVPDVKNFSAEFKYNFFVPDEGITEDGSVPRRLLEKAGETVDASFVESAAKRIPRYVRLTWSPVVMNADNKIVDEEQVLKTKINFGVASSKISDNLDKVMDEISFAGKEFTVVNLNDQSIDKKIYTAISGTAAYLNFERQDVEKTTQQQLALAANQITSDDVTYQFLSKYLVQPTENNVFFYEKNSQRIRNNVVNKLKDVNINLQINNKFVSTMMKNQLSSPYSMFLDQFVKTQAISSDIQKNARTRTQRDLVTDDYRTFGNHISAFKLKSTYTVSSDVVIVGYIIDKFIVKEDRTLQKMESIVIEDPTSTSTIDIKIRYYGKYVYSIRSVAEFTIPSIVEDTGELVVAKFLISSRPSKALKVDCVELVPPPSPTDLKFIWDYDEAKLNVTWSFPPNTQRDIKKFQVFRRSSIQEPFQMLKIIDFDDSVVKAEQLEEYFDFLIKRDPNPKLRFIDEEFTKDSKFIYTVCSIDAHGMTSSYGEQYEVSFDRFKNRMVLKRISASGAPKAYPNMFLLSDTFLDSIVSSGYRTLKIVFDPERYLVHDSKGNDLKFMATSQKGGSYRFQFINLDLQKQQDVNIAIDDVRTASSSRIKLDSLKISKLIRKK